jgi:hypothetical protein
MQSENVVPSMPNANPEMELPPKMEQAFQDTVNQYGAILAPGAVARLRKQTLNAYRNREIMTADAVTAGLTGFLLGDDHRAAKEKGDEEAARAANPKAFFLDGKKPEGDAPIRAVLLHLGNIKPESRQALERELADATFGRTHKEIAEAVLAHVKKRENWHHLAKQPDYPYGEKRVREALAPWRSLLKTGAYDELAQKWARQGNDLPQHLVNLRIAERLAQKESGQYFRDGEPIKVDYRDPDYQPQKLSEEDQALRDRMRATGMYNT